MNTVFLLSLAIFLLVSVMLAVGLIISGKKIRGSCGGLAVVGPDGERLSCDTCPNRGKNSDSSSRTSCKANKSE